MYQKWEDERLLQHELTILIYIYIIIIIITQFQTLSSGLPSFSLFRELQLSLARWDHFRCASLILQRFVVKSVKQFVII